MTPLLALFLPHGYCFQWNPVLIWLHALSDGLIAFAYLCIPVTLVYFLSRRRDLPFRFIFGMFAAFIVSCAITHILSVSTIWNSHYWVSGAAKAITALVSIATVVMLVRILPDALKLPGPAELQRNHDALEKLVHQRTGELGNANQTLQREVEERQRAEAEVGRLNQLLERRVDELQAIFEVLPIGIGIADDPSCKHIRANKALAAMLRMPANTNVSLLNPESGANPRFRLVQHGRTLAPAELPMLRSATENCTITNFDVELVFTEGPSREIRITAVPTHDGHGAVTGSVATFQDITAIKHDAIAGSRLSFIIESSEDAIIGKSLDGIVTDWNQGAERIFGYTAEEMIGQPIISLYPEDQLDQHAYVLARVRNGQSVPAFEAQRRRKDGKIIDLSIKISPIIDSNGKIVGASKLARDITAQKAAERRQNEINQKLQETQKLESLGVLAGGIAHDFNNLLTGILGNTSLARIELPPASPVHDYLANITTASRRAADLCRQMLAYSGRGRFVVAPVNLNALLNETNQLFSVSISKNAALRLSLDPALPDIRADATQLRQVIMNLVINASEAITAPGGVINVKTGIAHIDASYRESVIGDADLKLGDYVYVEISDNGHGMDRETLKRIFEPFFSTKFTGRGLGLAAVLGIVRGHKGALKVYSERDRGTTFKLFLPCTSDRLERTTPGVPPVQRIGGYGCILVVDDEEAVRTVASRTLQRLGFKVEVAADGREGIERYRAHPASYRLILLDLTMPNVDGEAAFREMRKINPDVRVLLMSGFNENEAISRFNGKGLAGFVQKPFEAEQLESKVNEALVGYP